MIEEKQYFIFMTNKQIFYVTLADDEEQIKLISTLNRYCAPLDVLDRGLEAEEMQMRIFFPKVAINKKKLVQERNETVKAWC
jgi:hypothetical protein